MNDYQSVLAYMMAVGYDRVNGYDFYREIFPDCERRGEMFDDYSHPNAIYLYYDEEKEKIRRRIMLKDTWADDYMEYVEENVGTTLCSGLMYRGRANKLKDAQQMNALIFDLDGVGLDEFRIIEARWNVEPGAYRSFPRPTYTVLSGTGLHLYYVFDEPIDLFPNIKIQLKSLKYDLTFSMWEYGETSKEESIQYQSINQSFRMPGSYNEKYKDHPRRVEAFRTGDRVTVDYLNRYVVDHKNRVDLERPFEPTEITRKEAQEKYPDWYRRVVEPQIKRREIEQRLETEKLTKKQRAQLEKELTDLRIFIRKEAKKDRWLIEEKVHGDDPYALYHWWIGQSEKVKNGKKPNMKKRIKGGHRYFFLMCMAIYASKCNVPKSKLIKDMKNIFNEIAAIPHKNQLTKEDMKSALETYDKEYNRTSIKAINEWTDAGVEKNKRNFRTQKAHLQDDEWIDKEGKRGINICRQQREFRFRIAVEDGKIGRPKGKSKQREMIGVYRNDHPEATPKDCIADTGISKNTVYRWWNS